MWNHIDLFSGIGGFSYAAKKVWKENYKTVLFCDNDRFCQAVLRKRFPGVPIWGDIRELVKAVKVSRDATHAKREGCDSVGEMGERSESVSERGREDTEKFAVRQGGDCGLGVHGELIANANFKNSRQQGKNLQLQESEKEIGEKRFWNDARPKDRTTIDLLTGGFPCQPFSHAGKRKGTDDKRYLWPEMLEAIRIFKPRWVIGENVRGLLSIEGGMVFEQVCLDLEKEGYQVWPFLLPACAVNAPHRRDRIWIVGKLKHSHGDGLGGHKTAEKAESGRGAETTIMPADSDVADTSSNGCGKGETIEAEEGYVKESEHDGKLEGGLERPYSNAPDSENIGIQGLRRSGKQEPIMDEGEALFVCDNQRWSEDWREVALATCNGRVDDGLPAKLDGLELSKSGHRVERLKALGNAIVPQVAMQIMKAIKEVDENSN